MRAARLPFVILDLHFTDEAWWRRETEWPQSAVHESDSRNGFPPELGERLMHETLMFAWQMARSDCIAAQVSFAMRPSVAATIGALMPNQVRAIASRRGGEIRVRWDDDSHFWRELLLAAAAGDDEAILDLHLHAKLLLFGALIYTDS